MVGTVARDKENEATMGNAGDLHHKASLILQGQKEHFLNRSPQKRVDQRIVFGDNETKFNNTQQKRAQRYEQAWKTRRKKGDEKHEKTTTNTGKEKTHLALSVEEAEQQLQHDDFFVGEQNLTR